MSTTTTPTAMSTRPSTWRDRFDFGLAATLLLCLFTTWPLWQQPGLPNGTDTLYHTYRAAEMDRAWTHGVLMPHWAESFYTGYGSPVFHYYASMTYYVTSVLMRIFTLNAVDSLRALTVLCMLLAGGGMYLFLRDATGRKLAGIIAALVYVYSPYLVFTEPYTRGAYPELLALAWFPLVMWRYERLLQTGGGVGLALAALSSGTLIITHNLMALVLTGLLAAWVGWRWLARTLDTRRFLWAAGAVMLGVALAAYFWLPVMLEQDAVRLGNLTAIAQLDYRNFFVPLGELLAFSPQPDAGAINGLVHQLNLGVAAWALALGGIIGGFATMRQSQLHLTPQPPLHAMERRSRAQRDGGEVRFLVFFALLGGVFIALMLPAAGFLWQSVGPLAFLQFPWRFLGPAAFCLAALAGMNALWLDRLPGRTGAALAALLVVLPITLALPTLYVDEWDNTTVDTSVAAYHQSELSGLQRATTFSDEYLPAAVGAEPSANAALLADFADGYPIDRANRAALPDGVTLDLLEHGPQHDVWQVTADQDFTLEVLLYDFPGWQAAIDGAPVAVQPSEPHGMVTIPVPAGEHTLRLFMGQTPPRWLGIGVSALALVMVLAAGLYLSRHTSPPQSPAQALSRSQRLGVVTGGIIQLALLLVFMREGLAWVHSPPGTALLAQDQTVYHLGGQIQLIGHDLNGTTFRPGDRLALSVYWYASEPVDYGYATFVHISNGGPPLAQADKQNPAGRPTLEWTTDGFVRDDYVIDLPETMPPGDYTLTVGLYTCDTRPPGECGNGDRLAVSDAEGRALGDAVPLATIEVR